MKILNLFFCFLFLISAVLQYNDPDPLVWIPIYLYGAVLCWLAYRKKFYPLAYIFGIMVYLAYAVYLFFGKDGVLEWIEKHNSESLVQSMKATKPWIEETREFLGLMILIVVLVVNLVYAKRTRSSITRIKANYTN